LSRVIRVSHLDSDLRTAPKVDNRSSRLSLSSPYAAHELHNTQDCQRSVLAPASVVRNTSGLTFFTSRLSPAVHPFCARLLYAATERRYAGRVHGTLDAPAPRLCAPPRPVRPPRRGCGGIRRWRLGRGAAKSEDQSEVEAGAARSYPRRHGQQEPRGVRAC